MALILDRSRVYAGFTRGNGLLARLIRRFTAGKVNHALLLSFSPSWNTWLEYGALTGGFLAKDAGRNGEKVEGLHSLVLLPHDLHVGMRANARFLGAPYDVRGLLGMTWVEVAQHLLKKQVKNPLEARHAVFCSEILARICIDSGVPLTVRPGSVDPHDLRNALLAVPGSIEIGP